MAESLQESGIQVLIRCNTSSMKEMVASTATMPICSPWSDGCARTRSPALVRDRYWRNRFTGDVLLRAVTLWLGGRTPCGGSFTSTCIAQSNSISTSTTTTTTTTTTTIKTRTNRNEMISNWIVNFNVRRNHSTVCNYSSIVILVDSYVKYSQIWMLLTHQKKKLNQIRLNGSDGLTGSNWTNSNDSKWLN